MKVLLVVPPKAKKNVFHILPPLGLGYLSAALKKEKIEVQLVNCIKDDLDAHGFINRVNEIEPDIIGYQVFSSDVFNVKTVISKVKEIHPNIINLVGGYHPSSVPEMAMTKHFPNADFGFAGEAEIGLPMFVKKIKNGEKDWETIPGLLWRKNGELKVNKPCFYENLDEIGMPDWEIINPLDYQKTMQTIMVMKLPVAPIIATRGCPFFCTFCAGHKINGRKIRVRSVENVIAEMDFLNQNYGVKEFHIEDDNFTWNRDYVMKFCKLLKEGGRKYYWAFPNGIRIDTLDEELLINMKKSGCYSICIGIESGSDRVLKLIKKGLKVELIIEKIRLIRKVGLPVTGFFIFGFPGEKMEDIMQTEKLILSEDFFAAHIFMYHPLPGTESFEELVTTGELNDNYLGYDANYSSYADSVYAPKGLSMEELKKIHRRINRKFFLNPKRFIKILLSIRSFDVFVYFGKRALAYLF